MSTSTTTTVAVTLQPRQWCARLRLEAYDFYTAHKGTATELVTRIRLEFYDAQKTVYDSLKGRYDEYGDHEAINQRVTSNNDPMSYWLACLAVVRDKHPELAIAIPVEWGMFSGRTLKAFMYFAKDHEDKMLQVQLPQLLSLSIAHNWQCTWRRLLKQVRAPMTIVISRIANSTMYWQAYQRGVIDPVFHQRLQCIGKSWRTGKRVSVPIAMVLQHCATLPHNIITDIWATADAHSQLIAKLHIIAHYPRAPPAAWSSVIHTAVYDHVDASVDEYYEAFMTAFTKGLNQHRLLWADIVVKMQMVASLFVERPICMTHALWVMLKPLRFQMYHTQSDITVTVKRMISEEYGFLTFMRLWKVAYQLSYTKGKQILDMVTHTNWIRRVDKITPDNMQGDIIMLLRQLLPISTKYPIVKQWVERGADVPYDNRSPATMALVYQGREYLVALAVAVRDKNAAALDQLLTPLISHSAPTVHRIM